MITSVLAHLGDEDVKTSKTGMAIAGEIKVAIGTECRKSLVAWSVDRLAEVLHATVSCRCDAYAPNVETAFSSRHVTREIEPFAVGRDSRMGITRQRVASELHLCGLAPSRVGTT